MLIRYRIEINGVVQGVGFRPFVYNLAQTLGVKGFVKNDLSGVIIEIEEDSKILELFLKKLEEEKPPLSQIYKIKVKELPLVGFKNFVIEKSTQDKEISLDILPDVATCEYCLKEMIDPHDRRYLYPFINCTLCGPRFTIIEKLPYDRENTAMRVFEMCKDCYKEYVDPKDRRFHAQPVACPYCGPYLELFDNQGNKVAEKEEALKKTTELLKEGYIVAVKGIGGFHLMGKATDAKVIDLLRKRKRRSRKPLAVMFKNLEQLKIYCKISPEEERVLLSPARPIVLLEGRELLPSHIAPGLKRIGAFLPYSPLHHLILQNLDFPVIATSGNFSDEPIVIKNEEAFKKLIYLADYLLMHNREILRRADDSVIKVINQNPIFIRRARGYAPLPIFLPFQLKERILAVGPRDKNTFAIGLENKVILSQHVGDIETVEDLEDFEKTLKDFMELYKFEPEVVVCDKHPFYETTKWAERFTLERELPLVKVQHHLAHILSCMAENEIFDEVLGIAWDGTGYGEDGTVWGGEFLVVKGKTYHRVAHLRHFCLIGGEKAIKEPKRVALALLLELYGEKALEKPIPLLKIFEKKELLLLYKAWEKRINSPLSSSCGRLFDAISALIGVNYINHYEGESPMILEDLFDYEVKDFYSLELYHEKGKYIIDWSPMIEAITFGKEPIQVKVSKFINTLAKACLEVALRFGIEKVCLSGGVMMNKPLVERITEFLSSEGFKVFYQTKVPPNDGGLSLGQVLYQGLEFLNF
ncbi:MAG: carbamoyltransferase HypF [Thermodesulfobacteriaceae bacterium]|nr:carbamoyltransferase HypF [Thermodesulfobacteriaceae bacterium]